MTDTKIKELTQTALRAFMRRRKVIPSSDNQDNASSFGHRDYQALIDASERHFGYEFGEAMRQVFTYERNAPNSDSYNSKYIFILDTWEEVYLHFKDLIGGYVVKDLNVGDKIKVRPHKSNPGKGLSYAKFEGTLTDHAGTSEGWDVVDVSDSSTGKIVSIYCFSIERSG